MQGAEWRQAGSLGKTPTKGNSPLSPRRPGVRSRPSVVGRLGRWRDHPAMENEDVCKRKLLKSRLLLRSCAAGHSAGCRAGMDSFDRRLLVLGEVRSLRRTRTRSCLACYQRSCDDWFVPSDLLHLSALA